jgi:hypothetical protein
VKPRRLHFEHFGIDLTISCAVCSIWDAPHYSGVYMLGSFGLVRHIMKLLEVTVIAGLEEMTLMIESLNVFSQFQD